MTHTSKDPGQISFGFLSTIDCPLLPSFLKAALAHDVKNIFVICDAKVMTEKGRRLWDERTGRAFEKADEGVPTVYSLGKGRIPFFFVKNHNNDDSLNLISELGI